MERILVGYASFRYLGWAFLNTIFGSDADTKSFTMDNQFQEATPVCCSSWESCEAGFYLNTPSLWFTNIGDSPSTTATSGNHEDACYGSDWIVFFIQFIICHIYSWGMRWFLIEPWVRWKLGPKRATKKRQEKFSQNLVALSFHLLSGYFAWKIISRKPWFSYWDPHQWFAVNSIDTEQQNHVGVDGSTSTDVMTLDAIDADFKFYYLLYAARYMSDLISLWYEHQRSDTWAYGVHHIATIILVFVSGQAGMTRIGGIIMSFLDWADPPMLIAKAFRYLSRHPKDWYQFMADRFFELFAIGFIMTRNVMYTYIALQAIIHAPNKIDNNNSKNNSHDDHEAMAKTTILILKVFLVVLVLLMKFWLWLIIRSAYHQFKNDGNIDDIRSDSESDDEGTHNRQNSIAYKQKKA